MGKGGEKVAEKKSSNGSSSSSSSLWTKREKKLAGLSVEELRKWAVAYGLVSKSEEGEREQLVELLVS